MDKSISRLQRLTHITLLLQSHKIVTASLLASKFDVSIRTIYRDIRALEQSGVPIITEEGIGYKLMSGYTLSPINLNEEEAFAIITAKHLLQQHKDTSLLCQYQNATSKIISVLNPQQKDKIHQLEQKLNIRQRKNLDPTSENLTKIQTYITEYRCIEITYTSQKAETTKRIVEPFALYHTNDNWILIAFCKKRNDFRAFRLDRILKIIEQPEAFTPHTITLSDYFFMCQQKYINTPDKPLTHMPDSFVKNIKTNLMDFTKKDAFNVVGITVRTTNENQQAAKDIPALWQKFMMENIIEKIPYKVNGNIFALYTNYEGDHMKPYDLVIGCQVENTTDIPEGMQLINIPEQRYYEKPVKGKLDDGIAITNAWFEIWQTPIERTYTVDMEFYKEGENPNDGEAKILVAVK